MIQPHTDSLMGFIRGIHTKTLIISCSNWKGQSYLKSNSLITYMPVYGLNLQMAGPLTLKQIGLDIDIFHYKQIILAADHPCHIQEEVIKNILANPEIYDFAKVLAKSKIHQETDFIKYSESYFTAMVYLRYQFMYLENFLENYVYLEGDSKPFIKGIIFKNNHNVFELDEFELFPF